MIRFDAIYVTLALMVVCAAIVLVALWLGLAWFLSLGQYIRSAA